MVIASRPPDLRRLAERLQSLLGADTALHFYDAAAPLVTAESVDMDKAGSAPGMTGERRTMSTAP